MEPEAGGARGAAVLGGLGDAEVAEFGIGNAREAIGGGKIDVTEVDVGLEWFGPVEDFKPV